MSVEEAAVALELSRDWLYNRIQGRTPITTEDDELFWEKAGASFDLPPSLVEKSLQKSGLLGDFVAYAPQPKARMRFAGLVPCSSDWGDPLQSEEIIEVSAQFGHPDRFAAKVVGESCWPALQPGDVTVWHRDLSPPFGVIVLAQRKGDHSCTVKKLEYDPKENRPRLVPVNTEYDAPDDGDGWGVIARLVGVERGVEAPMRTWFWEPGLRPEHLA